MTEQQAVQIRAMRAKGIGYKSIGMQIGLSRDIVRNYCKSRGLSGYGKAIKKNIEDQAILGKKCLCCGKPITQPSTGRHKKFCDVKCRREWWKNNGDKLKKNESAMYSCVCKRCGEEFKSYGNKNRKFCSHDCYIRYRFWEENYDEDSAIGNTADFKTESCGV